MDDSAGFGSFRSGGSDWSRERLELVVLDPIESGAAIAQGIPNVELFIDPTQITCLSSSDLCGNNVVKFQIRDRLRSDICVTSIVFNLFAIQLGFSFFRNGSVNIWKI